MLQDKCTMKAESICIQPWDKRQPGKDNREHHTTISTINITENEGPRVGKKRKTWLRAEKFSARPPNASRRELDV